MIRPTRPVAEKSRISPITFSLRLAILARKIARPKTTLGHRTTPELVHSLSRRAILSPYKTMVQGGTLSNTGTNIRPG